MPVRTSRVDWAKCAERLSAAIPRARLHPAVTAWAEASGRRTRWTIGFSGGADSLALLLLLWAHWPERRESLRALHFDHRLRGKESTADAAFCRAVCRALRIECRVERWHGKRVSASEAEARAARMEFFARHGRVLWLGHQQDDIAETMLMRLARGSGSAGLAAPRPVHAFDNGRVHLRPLLTLKKADVVAALTVAGASWREDATNETAAYFRNRVRSAVVRPWAEAAGRDALGGAARARALLEEDDDALDAWLADLDVIDRRDGLRLAALDGKPRAIVRRALHRWFAAQRTKLDVSSQAFEALLAAVEAGRATRHSLGPELFGVIRDGILRLESHGKRSPTFLRRFN